MTLKILTIGDPHFKGDNECDTDKLQSEVLKLIDERDINTVVVLGDIMHDHGKAKMDVYNRACKFLLAITKKLGRDNVFVLIGNHDRINNKISSGDCHFFQLFKHDLNIYPTIVDNVLQIVKDDKKFVFVQYIEPGLLQAYLDKAGIEIDDVTTFFMHQEFKGCRLGSQISQNGDAWDEDNPFVVSGHIHEFQTPQSNIMYIGTPMQVSFGCGPNKYVAVLTYEGDTSKPEIEKISLDIPKKLNVRLSCSEFNNYDVPDDSWIKFKIHDTSRKISALKQSNKYEKVKKYPKVKFTFTDINDKIDEIHVGECKQPGMICAPFQDRIKDALITEKKEIRKIFEEIEENL